MQTPQQHQYSSVTAVLPRTSLAGVYEALHQQDQHFNLVWDGRGTLLSEQWWRRWVPPISPAKSIVHMIAPSHRVELIERTIIEQARLDKQSTGAVFSNPCSHTLFGGGLSAWVGEQATNEDRTVSNILTEELSAIYCIVGHNLSDRVSHAAIRAGAHGPIVFYSEGRGLRDRLGWLRITKEHEKEVLLVIAEEDQADGIFNAMADAGQLHLPGRGFMYRVPISKGMFNLPSRMTHQQHEASMQQIIHAIDHLTGHQHWRDQAVFKIQGKGRAAGLNQLPKTVEQHNQACLSVIVHREEADRLLETLLDSGAPGLNFNYARLTGDTVIAGSTAHISDEYALLRCITGDESARHMCALLGDLQSDQLSRFCAYLNPAPRVATYVPGKVDHRVQKTVSL